MPLIPEFRQVAKPSELIQALGALWQKDKTIEGEARRYRRRFIILLVVTIVLSFGAKESGALYHGVLVAFGAVTAVLLVVWLRYRAQNLDDRRILTPLKFLEVLQVDISPRDPVKLNVDFRNYRKGGRQLSRDKQGAVTKTRYEHTWFDAEGYLADKTRFRLTVTMRVGLAEKSKRKYTKRKERIRETVLLRLRPSAAYPDCSRFGNAAGEVLQPRPGSGQKLTVSGSRSAAHSVLVAARTGVYLRLRDRSGTHESAMENLVTGDALLTVFAAAFDRLNQFCRPAA